MFLLFLGLWNSREGHSEDWQSKVRCKGNWLSKSANGCRYAESGKGPQCKQHSHKHKRRRVRGIHLGAGDDVRYEPWGSRAQVPILLGRRCKRGEPTTRYVQMRRLRRTNSLPMLVGMVEDSTAIQATEQLRYILLEGLRVWDLQIALPAYDESARSYI